MWDKEQFQIKWLQTIYNLKWTSRRSKFPDKKISLAFSDWSFCVVCAKYRVPFFNITWTEQGPGSLFYDHILYTGNLTNFVCSNQDCGAGAGILQVSELKLRFRSRRRSSVSNLEPELELWRFEKQLRLRSQAKFPTSAKISDVLLFVSNFASQIKEVKFGDYFFDVCCAK